MASTTDIGPLFFQVVRFATLSGARAPLFGRIPSQETEPPYRFSEAVYLRVPFTDYGIVIGYWMKSDLDEEEALYLATSGRGFDLYDGVIDLQDAAVRDAVRRQIAANASDLDEEWAVVQMLLGDDPDEIVFSDDEYFDYEWDEGVEE